MNSYSSALSSMGPAVARCLSRSKSLNFLSTMGQRRELIRARSTCVRTAPRISIFTAYLVFVSLMSRYRDFHPSDEVNEAGGLTDVDTPAFVYLPSAGLEFDCARGRLDPRPQPTRLSIRGALDEQTN